MSGRDSQPTALPNEEQTLVEKLRSRADRWQPWIDDDLEAEFGYRPEHMRFHQALDRQAADEIERLRISLRECVATIDDYLAYKHDGDPWAEDARAMGEMDINRFQHDGRLERAKALVPALDVSK